MQGIKLSVDWNGNPADATLTDLDAATMRYMVRAGQGEIVEVADAPEEVPTEEIVESVEADEDEDDGQE
jgi:hypothetical protein